MNLKTVHLILAISTCLQVILAPRTVSLQITGRFKTHPMLYFSGDDVPVLQKKAATTHKHLADILKVATKAMVASPKNYLPSTDYEKFGSQWNEVYGNNLAALAFYCVLYPDDVESRNLAITFMDNLYKLPKWQVISLPKDEVPVAHTFTGFTTAFDFLYKYLDKERQTNFLNRITEVTKEFEHYARVRAWGRFYIQNHVATNYLALIHGCLIVQAHSDVADPLINFAVKKFEATMFLLNQIVDGSLDEGVAYGSYTSRSVTQYIFLALRHWDIDHTKDFWVKQHFWFYYYTILPGFQKNVAIADSNYNWFYGPESQLVFLDAFVLKNGHGNWLASEIRKHRSPDRPQSSSQKWCTIHTEFIWYNPDIAAKAPVEEPVSELHVFSDWGVSTWSKFTPQDTRDTFLAFKSGKLHGQAVFDVVNGPRYKSWVRGWPSFNPGHEHPDQNMFIFAPNGQMFISDALYAPKYTFLNNVLTFAPSDASLCLQPWVGQLGECEKWLKWQKPEAKHYGGEMITSITTDGLVHISGEAKNAYHPDLGLKSVYRNVILLNQHLLLVVDRVEKAPECRLKLASAFFHNTEVPFESDKLHGNIQGAKITANGKDYRMAWLKHDGSSPVASIQVNPFPSSFQKKERKYVNVTFGLSEPHTTMMYVFASPMVKLSYIKFAEHKKNRVKMDVRTSKLNYRVSIVTTHDNPRVRFSQLGFSGFAKVTTNTGQLVEFGRTIYTEEERPSQSSTNVSNLSIVMIVIIILLLLFALKVYRLIRSHAFRMLFLLIMFVIISHLLYNVYISSEDKQQVLINSEEYYTIGLPNVVITSLPGSGAELLSQMFQNNPDFLYLTVPSKILRIPETEIKFDSFIDMCIWDASHRLRFPSIAEFMRSLVTQPRDFIIKLKSEKQSESETEAVHPQKDMADDTLSPLIDGDVNYKEYTDDMLVEHSHRYQYALPALELTSGSWAIKLPWLHEIMDGNLRSLYVVCDPRMWINNLLIGSPSIYQQLNIRHYLQTLFDEVDVQEVQCSSDKSNSMQFETLRQVLSSPNAEPHRILAHLWLAYTGIVSKNQKLLVNRMKIVIWEDIIKDPERSIQDIYQFIDMPVRPLMKHQILQATKSDLYSIPYLGIIGEDSMEYWKTQLTAQQVKDIEQICSSLMKTFGYTLSYI